MIYTGTCQACGATLRTFSGNIAIHSRNNSKCPGSNKPPFEHDKRTAELQAKTSTDPEHKAWQSQRLRNWRPQPLKQQ